MKHLKHIFIQNRLINGFAKLGIKTQISITLLVVILFSAVIYQLMYFVKYQTVYSSLESSSSVDLKDFEQNEVLKEINELYTLEPGQEAVIGKITNIERLSSKHSFFKKAQNGDYLLIMPNFTLIYNRENKQVVDIARENLLDLKEMSQ